jgi:hypothetical protein
MRHKFYIKYDYGTGSTYLCVIADSEEDIVRRLEHVRVIDPAVEKLEPDHLKRLSLKALPIDDPFWDEMRKA